MLILLDQGTPVPIRRFLTQHTVRTATEQGWATLANGELLTAAEAEGFDVFVTTDKNLPFQQNLRASGRGLGPHQDQSRQGTSPDGSSDS